MDWLYLSARCGGGDYLGCLHHGCMRFISVRTVGTCDCVFSWPSARRVAGAKVSDPISHSESRGGSEWKVSQFANFFVELIVVVNMHLMYTLNEAGERTYTLKVSYSMRRMLLTY
jgi:hypothetical protein